MLTAETSGILTLDYFREVTKMVQLGNGATRYACYLIIRIAVARSTLEERVLKRRSNVWDG